MNHDEANQLMIAEKYLLNELSPDEREEFEEHYFECIECARDLRAGVAFLEQSKAILPSEGSTRAIEPSTQRAEKRGWLNSFFRPAFSIPVMALMLAVIGYSFMGPRAKPQLLSAVFVNVGSRGGNVPFAKVHAQDSFLVRVSVPPASNYSSYLIDIYSPSGRVVGSLKIPASPEDDTYFLEIPPGHHDQGSYTVAVRAITGTGQTEEVGRNSFEMSVLP